MMAKKINAWTEFGPRLEPADPVSPESLMRDLLLGTNQTRGSVHAILDELDAHLERALSEGRIVQLPNGMHFQPVGKKDGSLAIHVRVNPDLLQRVNANFLGKWRHAENIGKSEAEIIALWNAAHPDDPVEP